MRQLIMRRWGLFIDGFFKAMKTLLLTYLLKVHDDQAPGVTYHIENRIAGDQLIFNVILVVFQLRDSPTTVSFLIYSIAGLPYWEIRQK